MYCEECKQNDITHAHSLTGGKYICADCRNKQRYEAGEEGFFLCPKCGKADSPTNWIGGLPRGLCFNCSFWQEFLEEYQRGECLAIDGKGYTVGEESPSRPGLFRDYGGQRFLIESLATGKRVETTNLWHRGTVPPHFRKELPDTARFVPIALNRFDDRIA